MRSPMGVSLKNAGNIVKRQTILNMQDGRGYFIPDKSDKDKLRHYINQEHDRSIAILRNLKMAHNMLADMEHGRI